MTLGDELSGLLVVSLEHAVAAPYCSLLLADAGARVIKVERPGGDFARDYDRAARGHSAHFVWLNRGKQSVVLDINEENDLAILRRMLEQADVFLYNVSHHSLERRGLSCAELRTLNSALITCEITGYGRTGPLAGTKAYDLLVQAETGLCSITGGSDGPARVGISLCDIATGTVAFSAILRALLQRARTKEGLDLSIAMFDVLADWMNVPFIFQRYLGAAPERVGVNHPSLAPYGLYHAGDGGRLVLAIQSNREWIRFCAEVLGQPDFATQAMFRTNEDRVTNRRALDEHLDRVFGQYSLPDLLELLRDKRIACSRFNSVADLVHHPQLHKIAVEVDGNTVEMADLPLRSHNKSERRTVPALDSDGIAIRREFAKE